MNAGTPTVVRPPAWTVWRLLGTILLAAVVAQILVPVKAADGLRTGMFVVLLVIAAIRRLRVRDMTSVHVDRQGMRWTLEGEPYAVAWRDVVRVVVDPHAELAAPQVAGATRGMPLPLGRYRVADRRRLLRAIAQHVPVETKVLGGEQATEVEPIQPLTLPWVSRTRWRLGRALPMIAGPIAAAIALDLLRRGTIEPGGVVLLVSGALLLLWCSPHRLHVSEEGLGFWARPWRLPARPAWHQVEEIRGGAFGHPLQVLTREGVVHSLAIHLTPVEYQRLVATFQEQRYGRAFG